MSQMKIWKIIKRRREQRATEHLRQAQLQDQAEEDLGRKVEEGNERDRITWEAAYGKKSGTDPHVDSGVGTEAPSVGKASLSIAGSNEVLSSRLDSIELNDLERGTRYIEGESKSGGKGKARATVTVRIASDDDVAQASAPASAIDGINAIDPHSDDHSSSPEDSTSLARPRDMPQKQGKAIRSFPGPEIVPLPFKVPLPDLDSDRRSSIAASVASDQIPMRMSKKLSGGSLKRTSSKRSQRSYIATSTSEEALLISHNHDDDGASSVEAAVDEVSDGQKSEVDGTTLAGLPTPDTAEKGLLKFSPPTEPHPVERPAQKISKMSLGQISSQSTPAQDENLVKEETKADDHAGLPEAAANNVSPTSSLSPPSKAPSLGSIAKENLKESTAMIPPAPEPSPKKPALGESLADLDNASKVVMAYRTNEWAKHLDRAEKPSLDDLRAANP
ncbi:MAG: hypothetical protein Q9225_007065, partial [Loekoesia sp. 1 TL-2023]